MLSPPAPLPGVFFFFSPTLLQLVVTAKRNCIHSASQIYFFTIIAKWESASYSWSSTTSTGENSNLPCVLRAGNFTHCCFLLTLFLNAVFAAIATALQCGRQPLCFTDGVKQAYWEPLLIETTHAVLRES